MSAATGRSTAEPSGLLSGLEDPRLYRHLIRWAQGIPEPSTRADAEELVTTFFAVGLEVAGSRSAFGIVLAAMRETLPTWIAEYRHRVASGEAV